MNMEQFYSYLSEVVSFLVGAAAGSLVTLHYKRQTAGSNASVVDQSHAKSDGDIVGRDKSMH